MSLLSSHAAISSYVVCSLIVCVSTLKGFEEKHCIFSLKECRTCTIYIHHRFHGSIAQKKSSSAVVWFIMPYW